MNKLTIISQNGAFVAHSKEVAEMVGKNHQHLLRDVRGYVEVLEDSPNLDSQDFFIESTYLNSQNKIQPCYLLTKKGCDMVANKMTGEKGILFTAEYVTRFDEMERSLTNNQLVPTVSLTVEAKQAIQVAEELTRFTGKIQEFLQDNIQVQVNEIKDLIGMRDRNTKSLTGKLKEELFKAYNRTIPASHYLYTKAKGKVFREFKVTKWEEIPVGKYNAVFAYIENMEF